MTMSSSLLALESSSQCSFVEIQDFGIGAPQSRSLGTIMVVVHHPESAHIDLQGWRVDIGDCTISIVFQWILRTRRIFCKHFCLVGAT